MKRIPLTRGQFTLVDDEDYDELIKHKWHFKKNTSYKDGCAARGAYDNNGRTKTIRMHRVILKAAKGEYVDHVNHDTLDNRRANLRICTHRQNQMNRKKGPGTSSKYKGVCWAKDIGQWYSGIKTNYKRIHLGSFHNERDAALAYDNAARELFGEFAWLNFPERFE